MTNKAEYMDLFTKAVRSAEIALVYSIDFECFEIDGDYLYAKLTYQIDDRIKELLDIEVESMIQKQIGEEYRVSVNRMDAYPNGYASYNVIIDK